jgi:hypothetical protein
MDRMADPIDPRLLDKRVSHRYLRKGRLDEREYQRHLEALPDLADQAEDVESEFQSSAPARPQPATAPEPDGLED